jgi:vanillate/4-hydroxybenzoate decarboxylase subunit D
VRTHNPRPPGLWGAPLLADGVLLDNRRVARPETPFVSVIKEPVAGSCTECGAEALARYPVVGEHGWAIVTKCQSCLHSVKRERWDRLGPYKLLVDSLR